MVAKLKLTGLAPSQTRAVRPGRPTYADIHLDALAHNLTVVRRAVGGARVLAVVKADAYGHGAVEASRALVQAGAWGLAVSLVEEGVELRDAGLTAPILVLGGVYPGLEDTVVGERLTPVVWETDHLDRLAAASRRAGQGPLPVHVKIDTGMSRLGLLPEELPTLLDHLAVHAADTLRVEGVMTHLACADEPDDAASAGQVASYLQCLDVFRAHGIDPGIRHVCNSAGLVAVPRAHLDMVRPGVALYGSSSSPHVRLEGLRHGMSMRSHVASTRRLPAGAKVSYGHRDTLTRDSVLAAVPVGYEDGYMRSLSGRAEVLVGGHRCRVVGNVTMDTCMVDVTDLPEVQVGSEVVLLGSQGAAHLDVAELAEWAGVIPYEVLCGVSKRVPRR